MPAGDLITGDDQVELQGLLIGGAGSGVSIDEPGIAGIDVPTPKSNDVDLELADGSYAPPDHAASPTITVPVLIDQPTAEAAMASFLELRAAWQPVAGDVELHLRLAGLGQVFFTGRPRGLAVNLRLAKQGSIQCLGTFLALDPEMHPAGSAPAAPTIGTAVRGNASASVAWTSNGAGSGGHPITASVITPYIAGVAQAPQTVGATSPQTVTGLANGTAYTFKVSLANAVGTGAQSAASNSVTPATTPGAPTIGVATSGAGTATANWTAPASTGGSAITGYQVETLRASDNVVLHTDTVGVVLTLTKSGLTGGVGVKFRVSAINAVGTGPVSSVSNTVTPTAPTVPTEPAGTPSAVAGANQGTVTWSAPTSDGGSPITGYGVETIRVASGALINYTVTPATPRSHTTTGLTTGNAYRFQIYAINAVGTSVLYATSNNFTAL